MNCPKCDNDMEFEEAKNWHGVWYCTECEYEADGSCIPCAVNDYEETIEKGENDGV